MSQIKYKFHPLAELYPRMIKSELENLILSMEDIGFDSSHPILLFEGKILDGINRYLAAEQANVEPIFITFSGSYEEAISKSRELNSFRRHLNSSQKAMIAAKEILASREEEGNKKLTISRASILHAISQTYVKEAMQIITKNEIIANSVFNGLMTIREANYKIEEISRIEQPNVISENSSFEFSNLGNDNQQNDQFGNQFELQQNVNYVASKCIYLNEGQICPLLQN